MSRLLLFSALNYLFSAPCFLKTAFLLANHNREIFFIFFLGFFLINSALLKYIFAHKHDTRYIFEKVDCEVIPIKVPVTEL